MAENNYKDIIDLPRPVSLRHSPMSRENRAAQFAPFAALTGYDDSVKEEARLTVSRPILTEDESTELNIKMALLSERLSEAPRVKVTYFLPDEKKDGGRCTVAEGELREINEAEGYITFSDKRKIPTADIYSVESEIFRQVLRGTDSFSAEI